MNTATVIPQPDGASAASTRRDSIPLLSKSRFLSGRQCHRRLWLESYRRELAEPADAMTRAVLENGARVGAVARGCVPGGVLVTDDHLRHDEAAAATRALLADETVPAIYEAAFTADGVRVRADVLARAPGGAWDLLEVKASTGVKAQHVADLAVQLHVLEEAGVPVRRAFLVHLDPSYVHPGGEWDLDALFRRVDLTPEVRALGDEVRRGLAAMRETLARSDEPARAIGAHCSTPYGCPFLSHCAAGEPAHPVRRLPGASWALIERLAAEGIVDAQDVPPDAPGVTLVQRRAAEALRTGKRFVDPTVAGPLRSLGFPVFFLDFETFMPGLPVFAGTRPYQTICFQWSVHVLHADGTVAHREYLHDGPDDPRSALALALVEALGDTGAVVAWSGYEESCLEGLEAALPGLAPRLARIRERIFDLLPHVRRHVYDPAFGGSFSLKSVAPALLPEPAYEGLAIQEGASASYVFAELRDPGTPPARRTAIREALLAYCGRDTELLLGIFRLLSATPDGCQSLSPSDG